MTQENLGSKATRGRLLHAPFLGRSHWPLGRTLGWTGSRRVKGPGPVPGASKGRESRCCQLGQPAEAARPGGFEPVAQLSTARAFAEACIEWRSLHLTRLISREAPGTLLLCHWCAWALVAGPQERAAEEGVSASIGPGTAASVRPGRLCISTAGWKRSRMFPR